MKSTERPSRLIARTITRTTSRSAVAYGAPPRLGNSRSSANTTGENFRSPVRTAGDPARGAWAANGEGWGQFSPDGHWVAYMSDESGRNEIYVRPFAKPAASSAAANAAGEQWQVSTAGGTFPRWRPDGRELYYIGPTGEMLAAPITATGLTLTPGVPVVLFPTQIAGGGVDDTQGPQYDVTRDGRFLINTELDTAIAPITLLQNWNPAAKK